MREVRVAFEAGDDMPMQMSDDVAKGCQIDLRRLQGGPQRAFDLAHHLHDLDARRCVKITELRRMFGPDHAIERRERRIIRPDHPASRTLRNQNAPDTFTQRATSYRDSWPLPIQHILRIHVSLLPARIMQQPKVRIVGGKA